MPIILMKIDDLASRGNEIQTMLRPISREKSGPAWDIKSSSSGRVIAIYDGTQPTSEYRDWRFSTFVQNFHAMYFEHWKRTEEDEQYWFLERAYLSIYQRINREEKEFLCLHCDPNISFEVVGSEDEDNKIRNKTISRPIRKQQATQKKQLKGELVKLEDANKQKYKKGPHLHIKAAADPLPHAHFALNLGHLDAVLESIDSLSEAMKIAIFMLKEEVLDTLPH